MRACRMAGLLALLGPAVALSGRSAPSPLASCAPPPSTSAPCRPRALRAGPHLIGAHWAFNRVSLPDCVFGRTHVRHLSATNAAVACLFLQSYAEKQGHELALPLSAAFWLLAGGRSPLLLRYHLVPAVQGFFAARILRCVARICYSSFLQNLFSPAAPPRPPSLYATADPVVATRRNRRSIARRLGAVPRGALRAPNRLASVLRGGVAGDEAPAAPSAPAPARQTTGAVGVPSVRAADRQAAAGKPTLGPAAEASLVRPKKRVLILISDTGGGHRASAQALAETLRLQHGDSIETSIVDVWTDYGPYPWGKNMVPYYRGLAKRPALWHAHFRASAFTPTCYLMSRLMSTVAYKGFETCIREHAPDVVVSMHPLCQAAPIKVLRTMERSGGVPRKVPFVTVVTDLATPHPLWLHAGSDLCFVPSRAFEVAAKRRGLTSNQMRLHGLPVSIPGLDGVMEGMSLPSSPPMQHG